MRKIGNAATHGKEGTRLYDCWVNMKQRCLNSKVRTFSQYGGRGIIVCDRWMKFENFFKDMGEMPDGYSIDRIDPNGNYEPNNCRWLPRGLQVRNIRKSIFVKIDGENKHLADWCEDLGLNYKVIFQRIKRDGMNPMEALSKPITRSRARNGSAPLQEERTDG